MQGAYCFLFLSMIRKIPVSRICLHNNDASLLHEMYMFHSCPSEVGPLKQFTFDSISYHIINGSLEIELLNDVLFIRGNKNNITVESVGKVAKAK